MTRDPGRADVGLSVIDGDKTVNGADAVFGDDRLSVAVIVTFPGEVIGVVIKVTNVPIAEDFGWDGGVTSVPLNDKWINEFGANAEPVTLTILTGRPDVGPSTTDVVTANITVLELVPSVAVTL